MEMGYDFAASEINEAAVRTQHRCEFLDGAQNVTGRLLPR